VYQNVSLHLTDITGKTILHVDQQTLDGVYQLPVTLTQGMYFLTLQNEAGKITKKLIRE
jgi:hypothetical protein